jgi:hypothetical protein
MIADFETGKFKRTMRRLQEQKRKLEESLAYQNQEVERDSRLDRAQRRERRRFGAGNDR